MRLDGILKLLDRALVEDEVKLAYVLEYLLTVEIFHGHPLELGVDPLEVVVEGLDVFKADDIVRLRLAQSLLKLLLPAVLGNHLDKLLYDRMKLVCSHES